MTVLLHSINHGNYMVNRVQPASDIQSAPPTRKKSITALKWLGGLLIIIAIGAVAGYLWLPVDKILEQQLKQWLAKQGIEAEFTISTLTGSRLIVDGVSLAGENTPKVESIKATYTLSGLSERRVDTLEISGAHITLTADENGKPVVVGLESLMSAPNGASKSFTLPPLPFNRLEATNTTLTYHAPNQEPISITADAMLNGDYSGDLRIADVTLPVADDKITLTNIHLNRETGTAPIALSIDSIAHLTKNKAYFTPLKTAGEFVLASDNSVLSGTLTIQDLPERWTLNAIGDVQPNAGTWNIHLEQPAVTFENGALQPETLFPVLQGMAGQVAGSLSLKGNVGKTADAPMHSRATITLDKIGTTVKDIAVSGVDGEIAVALLYAPAPQTATEEPQSTEPDAMLSVDYSGELHIAEVTLPAATDEILLTNIHLSRKTEDAPIDLSVENIAHLTGKKAYFTPLKATGKFTIARDNTSLDGTMTIQDLRERWTLNATGDAQPIAQTWNVTFEQPVMTFESGTLQPDMLFPVLRGAMGQASGSVSLKGSAGKTANAPMHSRATITLAKMGATIKDIPVSGVDGKIALSSLYPPATDGKQTISVQEILLGLPLKNGTMQFTLTKDGKVTFAPSTWEWVNGQLSTAGASLNIYKPALPDITLSAKGLALEQLLGGLLKKGISATGTLSGTIPVHFTKDREAMIQNGKLGTENGGIVRFTPNDESPLQRGSSMQTDILLSALENFHYETIGMTINSVDEHELKVLLHVKGNNPELYNGQKIELNINLTGNLLDIVQSGMDVYTLPERLQEQLMQ